jgi:hypothetical protein
MPLWRPAPPKTPKPPPTGAAPEVEGAAAPPAAAVFGFCGGTKESRGLALLLFGEGINSSRVDLRGGGGGGGDTADKTPGVALF